MLNPADLEFEILYHWQNLKVISKLGVLNGIHSRVSVQPAMKYHQARAPSIRLSMKAKLVFGLPM